MDVNKFSSFDSLQAAPFTIRITCAGISTELKCTRILRVIPAKRIVCFGVYNEKRVVAKFFLDTKNAKRHFKREIKGLKALKRSEILTPDILSKKHLLLNGLPVLIFQRIEPAFDLDTSLKLLNNNRDQVELLARVAEIIAKLHNAGLKQNDLHFENFIVSGNLIFTIDGASIDTRRMGTGLPVSKSLKNLGLFLSQIDPRFNQQIPDILKRYLQKRKINFSGGLNSRMINYIRIHKARRKQRRLKKIFRESTDFVCQKSWNRFWVCDRKDYTKAMRRFLAAPDQAVGKAKIIKNGNSSTVAQIIIDNRLLIVKRYNIKNKLHALERCWRSSRASVSWRNAHLLKFCGVLTPRPVMFFEKRFGYLRSKAYFLMEYIDGVDAYNFFHSNTYSGENSTGLARKFGVLFQMLADASISHSDFKATNFIITSDKKIYLIDLDGLRAHRCRWMFQRAFKKDCRRFMQNWQNLPEATQMFIKQLDRLKL